MAKIKLEDVQYKIDGNEFSCWENGSMALGSFIDYWERNKDSWDEQTKRRNFDELCKIEGFEEWYNNEKIPDFYECYTAFCYADCKKTFEQTVFQRLSDKQKKEFLQDLKDKRRVT